jgi:6-phosphogluconolactonase
MADRKTHIYPSPEAVVEHAARTLEEVLAAPGDRKVFIALSGGSTPVLLYRLLASRGNRIPWERLEVFFGDERGVPPDHPDSNYRTAREELISRVPLPAPQVHPMPASEPDLKAAALSYEEEIRRIVPEGPAGEPVFDLVWLGMGDDGHTASLFPGSPALDDTEDLVAANPVKGLPAPRMTFTLPLINNARKVQFLVTGSKKAPAVRQVLGPPEEGSPIVPLPAARVQPLYGELEWILDREAARLLQDPGLIA